MKLLLAIPLGLILCLGLVSCGSDSEEEESVLAATTIDSTPETTGPTSETTLSATADTSSTYTDDVAQEVCGVEGLSFCVLDHIFVKDALSGDEMKEFFMMITRVDESLSEAEQSVNCVATLVSVSSILDTSPIPGVEISTSPAFTDEEQITRFKEVTDLHKADDSAAAQGTQEYNTLLVKLVQSLTPEDYSNFCEVPAS